MINTRDVNIQMITTVARRLGNLREKVVFVGSCATGLFIIIATRSCKPGKVAAAFKDFGRESKYVTF